MGRITERVNIKNYGDLLNVASGTLDPSKVRSADVLGIVDTGASYLCLPPPVVRELGLPYSRSERVRTANGLVQRRIFKGAEITIRERDVQMQVMENDETRPALIGCLVLEALDFVTDPNSERLIGNPEHDGEWMAEMY